MCFITQFYHGIFIVDLRLSNELSEDDNEVTRARAIQSKNKRTKRHAIAKYQASITAGLQTLWPIRFALLPRQE